MLSVSLGSWNQKDPSLFLLVATQQKVANLPPCLEFGHPGDHVLWVVTQEARNGRWVDGPDQVLRRHGFTILPPVEVGDLNDVSGTCDLLQAALQRQIQPGQHVYAVLNGGKKLTPVAVVNALQPESATLLYGDEHGLYAYPKAGQDPFTFRPYQVSAISLEDILQSNGLSAMEAHQLWPGPQPPASLYETSIAKAAMNHATHFRMRDLPEDDDLTLPNYTLLKEVSPDLAHRWSRNIRTLVDEGSFNDQRCEGIFNTARKLLTSGRLAVKRHFEDIPRPPKIGPEFEKAVAARVWRFLEADPNGPVLSAWTGVKAITPTGSDNPAEWDIALVLSCGVLLHIECKSTPEVPRKELDARQKVLERSASNLARTVVCLPLFTGMAQEPWVQSLARRAETITNLLPYTLPGQPTDLLLEPVERRLRVPDFESSLAQVLARYRPQPVAGA